MNFPSRLVMVLLVLLYHGFSTRAHADEQKKFPATTGRSITAPKHLDDAQLAPGLIGEYFRDVKNIDEIPKSGKPFLVRTDKRIHFDEVYGQFYDTKLSNNFAARWNGILRIATPGTYRLSIWCDDKSRLYINDQLAIDNTKERDNSDNDYFELEKGDYPIRIEFFQGGGQARMFFSRQCKDSPDWDSFPESQLFHLKSQEKVEWDRAAWESVTWDRAAWFRDFAPKFMKMDYGPSLAATYNAGKGNVVLKGIAIKLGKPGDQANVIFDTELLRYAAGWTGGFIDYHGVAFDGAHGVSPSIEGTIGFQTKPDRGATSNGDFHDPRPQPLGPIAREYGHYKGLYRNGDRVIISYSIGRRDVLDMPHVEVRDGKPVFMRTLQVMPSDQPIAINLATVEQPDAPRWQVPPAQVPMMYEVEMGKGIADKSMMTTADSLLTPLCTGGPARWPQVIETKGTLGSGDGPYVVDTLTAPLENPWDAWLRFAGLDFFSDGRAALCTWSGDVWIVSGIDATLEHLKWKRYAAGIFQALGLKIVNDQVYVLGRDQITRLHDLNNDGEADFYENFNNDCIVSSSFHEFALDLQADAEGNFYFAKGGPVRPGGRGWQHITDHNGCVLRVSKDGSNFDVFATGVRAPNGMGVGPHGEISVSDNEGTWTPTCRLSFVHKGDFLGVPDLAHATTAPTENNPPIVWLPHEDVDNSSGGQTWVPDQRWGPFKDRLLHTSYGMCDLFLVMTNQVDGMTQGGIVKFPNLSFDTGIMRPRFRPQDGQFYVTGLKGWQTRGAKDGALHRVRFTGKPVRMPTGIEVGKDEVKITFTCALDRTTAADADSYNVEQWNYIWSKDYGSPEVTVDDPTKKGHDTVKVESVALSNDAKTITLKIPGLRPVMQQKISMKLDAADGTPLEYDVFQTINRVPK
jgi:hypothetical protein